MNDMTNRWLLPDGVQELLPQDARTLEVMRRQLLDLYDRWGFDFVVPPMLEFTDSLLTGSGADLDLLTFKLTDQLSGRSLGLRADMSPQTARMDAHSIARKGPCRLCYAGTVLRAKPRGADKSRMPIQVGAELFGVPNISADIEVVSLMLETLKIAGAEKVTLDLGHVALFDWLNKQLGDVSEVFELIQNKRFPELELWLQQNDVNEQVSKVITALPSLLGNESVLPLAEDHFSDIPELVKAISDLRLITESIQRRYPEVRLLIDLGELRGSNYHTGVIFAAYVEQGNTLVANGGRYDDVGAAFGRARAATGFSTDLKALLQVGSVNATRSSAVYAPVEDSEEFWSAVAELRAKGNRVVLGHADSLAPSSTECDRILKFVNQSWACVTRD